MEWVIIGVATPLLLIDLIVLLLSAFRFERQLVAAQPLILEMLDRQSLRRAEEIYKGLLRKGWHGDCSTVAQILSAMTAHNLLRRNTLTSRNRAGESTIGYSYELTKLGQQARAALRALPCTPVSSIPD